jgi:5-hydroxyisourate hydrolase-like protein (transthyretin family)
MDAMHGRFFLRINIVAALAALLILGLSAGAQVDKRGRKYKAPAATSRIEVTVLRDTNGKPIENAAVIFHAMVNESKKGNMELKTNEDGKTVIDVLPTGDTLRLQVIAKGFQTFGQDFPINKDQMSIEVRLKRPGEQYSIYKEKKPEQSQGKDTTADKAAEKDAPKDATPPAPQPK